MYTTHRSQKSFLSALLVLFAAWLPVSTAGAQDESFERGSQVISGFSGPVFDLSRETEDADAEDGDGVEFEADWAFGGSYQYFLSSKLSLEASLTFATGEGELEGPGADDPEDSDDEEDEDSESGNGAAENVSANALYFTGGVVYNFSPGGRFRPYVTAGAGMVRIDVDGSATSRPAGVFGAGVLIGLSRSLLVRVDARDHLYTLDQGGGSNTRNDLSLTGGVSFRF